MVTLTVRPLSALAWSPSRAMATQASRFLAYFAKVASTFASSSGGRSAFVETGGAAGLVRPNAVFTGAVEVTGADFGAIATFGASWRGGSGAGGGTAFCGGGFTGSGTRATSFFFGGGADFSAGLCFAARASSRGSSAGAGNGFSAFCSGPAVAACTGGATAAAAWGGEGSLCVAVSEARAATGGGGDDNGFG